MERRTFPSQAGQFHHYVPRFLVRRWLQEAKVVSTPHQKSKAGRKKGRQRPREYKQELINSYDIESDTLHMGTTDLGKTLGIIDLYKDQMNSSDVYRVEKAFSKLESDAARVFQILDKAEQRGCSSVELVRSQVNVIRKFLFLMYYRNGIHAHQFSEGRFDPSTAAMVEEYRAKYDLADARAVWLRNIALLLEDEHWEVSADERLLFTARADYKMDALDKQLGLYRAPPGTEFILTENALGLAEGARTSNSSMVELLSPGAPGPSFFRLTQSYPITPKLVIILRSNLLTQEAALIQNGVPAAQARQMTHSGLSNTSYFHDIPRTSPATTYIPPLPSGSYDWQKPDPSMMTPEDLRKAEDFLERGLLNGIPLGSRIRDKFVFAIDRLTEDQAQRVNTLLLTHCRETISFLTPACLLRSIGAFEKDRQLSIFGKERYASLRRKLMTEQASTSPTSALHPAAGPLSPDTHRQTASATVTNDSTAGSRPMAEAALLETSLPGLRGAFKRKPRSIPASDVQLSPLPDPVSLPTPFSTNEQGHTQEADAEVLSISQLPNDDSQNPSVYPRLDVQSSVSRAANDHHDVSDDAAAASVQPGGEQLVKLQATLPGLRGAFNSKFTAASKETRRSQVVSVNLVPPSEPV